MAMGHTALEPGDAETPLKDHPKGRAAEEQWSSNRAKKNAHNSSPRGAVVLWQMQQRSVSVQWFGV